MTVLRDSEGRPRLNDEERRMWVENDSGLYWAWQHSGQGLWRYVRENRALLDAHICAVLARPPAR